MCAMNALATPAPVYGTPRQSSWLHDLVHRLGHETVEAACKAYGLTVPDTVEETSLVISALSEHLPGQRPAEKAESKRSRFLTPLQLQKIDSGEMEMPDNLDAPAAWCLQRLASLRKIEQAMAGSAWGGVNKRGPILIDQLTTYFGSVEATASAFEVSVQTVRAWGRELPAARRFEAEVKTKGFVCA